MRNVTLLRSEAESLNRRALIGALPALALGGGLLAACAGGSNSNLLDRVAAEARAIDQGIHSVLPQLAQVSGINASSLLRIAGYADQVTALVGKIAAVADMNAAKPLVQQVGAYVNSIIAEIEMYPISQSLRTALTEVQMALPMLLALVQGA